MLSGSELWSKIIWGKHRAIATECNQFQYEYFILVPICWTGNISVRNDEQNTIVHSALTWFTSCHIRFVPSHSYLYWCLFIYFASVNTKHLFTIHSNAIFLCCWFDSFTITWIFYLTWQRIKLHVTLENWFIYLRFLSFRSPDVYTNVHLGEIRDLLGNVSYTEPIKFTISSHFLIDFFFGVVTKLTIDYHMWVYSNFIITFSQQGVCR